MDLAPDGSALPTSDELRKTLDEYAELLRGPSLPDVVEVRARRIVASTSDLLERSADDRVLQAVTRAIAWTAESIGAFQRLPAGFAFERTTAGEVSPALAMVDDLDLLGLTLDHTYDAVARGDDDAVDKQLTVLHERFTTDTEPVELVEQTSLTEDDLDQDRVEEMGLEVGDDGIPRMPFPQQPDPHHASDDAPEEDQR